MNILGSGSETSLEPKSRGRVLSRAVRRRSRENWMRMAEVEKLVSSAVDKQIQLDAIQEEEQLEPGIRLAVDHAHFISS